MFGAVVLALRVVPVCNPPSAAAPVFDQLDRVNEIRYAEKC